MHSFTHILIVILYYFIKINFYNIYTYTKIIFVTFFFFYCSFKFFSIQTQYQGVHIVHQINCFLLVACLYMANFIAIKPLSFEKLIAKEKKKSNVTWLTEVKMLDFIIFIVVSQRLFSVN